MSPQPFLFSQPRMPKRPAIEEQIEAAGLPPAETEVRFHPVRKWRFDYAWPARKIALEIHGDVFGRMVETKTGEKVRVGGYHNTGKGLAQDCEKAAWANILGWCLIPVTTTMVRDGQAIELLKAAFDSKARF